MSEYSPVRINMRAAESAVTLPAKVTESRVTVPLGMSAAVQPSGLPAYAGPYTVTPGAQAQILPTLGRRMTDDLTVEAIPSNWGRIGWNGAVLTVS